MSMLLKESAVSRKRAQGIYVQVLLVFLLFLLMVLSIGFFMSRTLNNRLREHVDNTVNWIQTSISSALLMPKLSMYHISETMQDMLRRGESFESIKAYMDGCSSPAYHEQINFTFFGISGYFNDIDVFYNGAGWIPDEADSFNPIERPWYKAAVAAGGKITFVPPYYNVNGKMTAIGYSRLLTGEHGQPLATITMSVPLTHIKDIITDNQITENGIGWLLDENMVFIAHQVAEDYINKSMYEIPRFAGVVDAMKQNTGAPIQGFWNVREEKSLMFTQRLDNGWYVGIVIPEADYYQDMYTMIVVISVIGVLAAAILSVILISLDKAKRKADTENQQKSDFLATVSHEIRTPMNTILGITEMQLHEEGLADNVKEAFDRIHFSGDLLLSIINDLLDLSKIEAGMLEIKPAKYEVASLLDEVIQINKLRYASSPLEFKLEVGENVPETLVGDELRVKQVLNNLLSNAFKYTLKGGVVLSITAETGEDENITLAFVVRDTGQGMTTDQIRRLFDRFTRFNMDTNRTVEGAGLGMNITQNLINMMNGSINVESEPGKGTTFTVMLPQRLNGSRTVLSRKLVENLNQRRVTSAAQVKRTQIIRKYMPYGSVLIVDDTEANLYVAKLLMAPYGFKTDSALSGFEAIEKIKSGNKYDIIFMDHMMPKMDGIEAVKIIRSLGYTEPIIALTANAVVGQADIFLTKGFDDFVSKPIDMRILDMMLDKYIYDKHPDEVAAAAQAEKEETDGQVNARQSANAEHSLSVSPGDADTQSADRMSKDRMSSDTPPFDIPGLNVGRGLAVFDDEQDTYTAALRSFTTNVPEIIDKLRAVTEENLPEYAINVHALKSVSGWICADGIQARAAGLEALAKAGNFVGVTTLNKSLIDETETFMSNLCAQLADYQ